MLPLRGSPFWLVAQRTFKIVAQLPQTAISGHVGPYYPGHWLIIPCNMQKRHMIGWDERKATAICSFLIKSNLAFS